MKPDFVKSIIAKTGRRTVCGFMRDAGGGMAMQAALVFGAAGLALALVGPPLMESAGSRLVAARQGGIDRTTTGSVSTGGRYTIRKSVLSDTPQVVCGARVSRACLPDGR